MLGNITLGLSGLLYLLFGILLFFNPSFLENAGLLISGPTATMEIRSFYGGLEIGLGVFLLVALYRSELRPGALLLVLLTSSGLLAGRVYGASVDGVEGNYLFYVVAIEFPIWVLALLAWRRERLYSTR